jgi:hypothetical protein
MQGWDAKKAAPVFANLLESELGQEMVKGKEAVVPGCGCALRWQGLIHCVL